MCLGAHKEYYLSIMRRLREQIRRKRADLLQGNSWILYQDNAPSHKAIIVNEFLSKNSTNFIEQPPYSLNMAPADFFLFPKLKLHFEAPIFIVDRRHKCIISGRVYFDGDKINLDE